MTNLKALRKKYERMLEKKEEAYQEYEDLRLTHKMALTKGEINILQQIIKDLG